MYAGDEAEGGFFSDGIGGSWGFVRTEIFEQRDEDDQRMKSPRM
jgi:hypothetical protein